MKKISLLITIALLIFLLSLVAQETGSFNDSRDGKSYRTVTIGTQTWMSENLAYKTNSGCWAYENNISNVRKYGYLYDWKTAQSVCPPGWHLPIDSEWLTLMSFLGSGDIAGGKLKSTISWESPNTGATNSSGFSALPSGARFPNGSFDNATGYCYWWRTKEYDTNHAYFIQLSYDQVRVSENYNEKNAAVSIRCLKN